MLTIYVLLKSVPLIPSTLTRTAPVLLLVTLKRSKPVPQKVKLAVGSLPIEPASSVV